MMSLLIIIQRDEKLIQSKQFLYRNSMGNSCNCVATNSNYDIHSFYLKNQYANLVKANEHKLQIILQRITPGYEQQQYKNMAAYISEQPNLQFNDPYFSQLQANGSGEVSGLQKMYNLSKRRLQNVYKLSQTPLDIFDQKQVELCYLASVFYLICQSAQLKQQIFITRHINIHNAYVVRLFCNGQPCSVIVDQSVPAHKKNIKYLSTRQPEQIWPFLLEKAWCKQIGAYDKARGLSPEDCFQQITGIPAYSFPFRLHSRMNSIQMIKEAKKAGCWVAFTGIVNTGKGLKSRQVFHLQKINQRTQSMLIRSPYIDFEILNKQRPIQGAIQMTYDQILNNFEYTSIGNYMPGYVLRSYSFRSQKDQQVIFTVNVANKDDFNIRVLQFYQQYLSSSEKQFYAYSPILMELYDERCKLIEKCEGRLENIEGIRSSNLSDFIFVSLNPGLYYLRVQVSWVNPTIQNMAHVVSYSSKNSITLRRLEKDVMDMSARLIGMTLQHTQDQIINQYQHVKVKHIQKTYGYVLGIENYSNQASQLKLIFKDSQNIKVNHHQFVDNTLIVRLEPLQQRVLQILPKNPKKQYFLAPFDIVKM